MIAITGRAQRRPRELVGCCPTCHRELPVDHPLTLDLDGGVVLRGPRGAALSPQEMALFRAVHAVAPRLLEYDRAAVAISQPDADEVPDHNHLKVVLSVTNRKLDRLAVKLSTVFNQGVRLEVH